MLRAKLAEKFDGMYIGDIPGGGPYSGPDSDISLIVQPILEANTTALVMESFANYARNIANSMTNSYVPSPNLALTPSLPPLSYSLSLSNPTNPIHPQHPHPPRLLRHPQLHIHHRHRPDARNIHPRTLGLALPPLRAHRPLIHLLARDDCEDGLCQGRRREVGGDAIGSAGCVDYFGG